MRRAAITFSPQGLAVCRQLQEQWSELHLYVHEQLAVPPGARTFVRIMELTPALFGRYQGLIYVAPCGLVVRALAAVLQSKLTDPAVVVVDIGARHVVSLLSGHEGGANDLAVEVANLLDAEPVITTTTDMARDLIVGIGCRQGKSQEEIVAAIRQVLSAHQLSLEQVRFLATARVKAQEAGLGAAARALNIPLRIIGNDSIRQCRREFSRSGFVEQQVNLPAVAEPAALLAGRRTSLIVPRQALDGITVAIARENCSSLA